MEKTFNDERKEYFKFYSDNISYVINHQDDFKIPSINKEQTFTVVKDPENETELRFAYGVVTLCKTLADNKNILDCSDNFDVLHSDGYEFLEIGTALIADEIEEVVAYNLTSGEEWRRYNYRVREHVLETVEYALGLGIEKYHKICCDLNLIGNINYARIVKSQLIKDWLINIAPRELNKEIWTNAQVCDCIWQLESGIFNMKDSELETPSHSEFEDAIKFLETFNEYIISLSAPQRKKVQNNA